MNVTTTTGSSSNPTVTTTQYYFVKNLQGDIVAIADATGEIQFTYTYDSWGKVLSTKDKDNYSPLVFDTSSPANINPFRYRGYYYDAENEIYWLQSRFYDPSTGRFLNADGYVTTGQDMTSYNMFVYCGNNPVNRFDYTGAFWEEIGTFFKDVGTAVYNGAKRLLKATIGSFQLEGGIGHGLGVTMEMGPVKASAGAYQDGLTLGFKNGESYTANKGAAGVEVGVGKNMSIGVSTEYEHRFETNCTQVKDKYKHTAVSAPWDVYQCPETVKNPFQLILPIVKPIEGELSDNLFIGVNLEAHVIFGGHITVGWDVDEFLKILTE